MIKNFIAKINLNIQSMVKYGSIATFTMFLIIYLFGMDNAMLAFPIALTAIALSFENININPFYKWINLVLLDCILITLSYLASLNPFIGLILNFITIFFIAFTLTIRFNPKIYKPFIMLFVFTSFSVNNSADYLKRIFAILIGVTLVFFILLILNRPSKRRFIRETLYMPLTLIRGQLNNILIGNFSESISMNISKEMQSICYKVYITKGRKHPVSNIGNISFSLFLTLEYLNIFIKENFFELATSKRAFTLDFEKVLSEILEAIDSNSNYDTLNTKVTKLIDKYKDSSIYKDELLILNSISNFITDLLNLNRCSFDKHFANLTEPKKYNPKLYFKDNFKFGNIRFNFALRISITLTLTIFLGHIYSFYKFIWVAITVMSVMQPSISKGKERLIGNAIGIVFLITLLTIVQNDYVAIVILVLSLYLTYGFKEYYKLSLFASMASISVASLSSDLKIIAINRISFLLLGIVFVYLGNKFLFPSNLKTGAIALIKKIVNFDLKLLDEYLKEDSDNHKIRDLVIYVTLCSNKLSTRNSELKNEYIRNFITSNNEFIIKTSFLKINCILI